MRIPRDIDAAGIAPGWVCYAPESAIADPRARTLAAANPTAMVRSVTKGDPERAELLFLRSYKDAIMYFNMLDRNLAYCLRWASKVDGSNVDIVAILALSFDRKLKK